MSSEKIWIAAAQMTSGADRAKNLDVALRLVGEAAGLGAALVGLPENFSFMGPEADRIANAEPLDGPTISRVREVARAQRIAVLAGSFPEKVASPGRTANTSVLVDAGGELVAAYRKIHLFDVSIPDGARYAESETVEPGRAPVTAALPFALLGLSVCYDLRFPELYRALSREGAELLTVPSAFTLYTGKDHWEPLLRARAIENLCYVLAPAQFGRHGGNRVTYGHATIVDPWGTVLAQCADGVGLCAAPFDRERVAAVRRELPALSHRRL